MCSSDLVHAATEYMIRNTRILSDRQREAVTNLYTMFNYAKDNFGAGEYGFTDIYEFVSEALTNPKFQAKLRGIHYKATKSSALNAFVNFVLRMFGVNNVASAAMVEANEIFSAKREDGKSTSTKLRFAPQRKRRYKRGPLTSSWRAAEDMTVRMYDMVKSALTSLPEAGKLGYVLKRAADYNVRQAELPFLSMPQLKGEVSEFMPYIGAAISVLRDMDSYRKRIMGRAKTIVERWVDMQLDRPAQSRLLGKIMQEATIQGTEVDPQGPGYVDPAKAGPGDKVAPPELEAAWNALDGDFQQLYRDVRNYYTSLLHDTIREMKMRVLRSGKTSAEKKALLREINRQFGSFDKNVPYFPLRRFGDFWFQVTANGFSEFYTFESHSERDAGYMKRYDELTASKDVRLHEAAADMRSGNKISELYTESKDAIGALKDVNDLIKNIASTVQVTDPQTGQKVSVQRTADEIKSDVTDAVNQLVYVLLDRKSTRLNSSH